MIKAILACDMDMGIGKSGTLPWPHDSTDLKHFKDLTTGHYVVMGSKTWDDPVFPGPLKDRINMVVTSKETGYEGATHIKTAPVAMIENIARNSEDKDIWIIGGASIYELFSNIIEEWHVTLIQGQYDCDTFIKFPEGLVMESYETLGENKYVVYRKEK